MILGSFETSRNIAIAGLGDDSLSPGSLAPPSLSLDTGSGSSDTTYNPMGTDAFGLGPLSFNPGVGPYNPNTQPYGSTMFGAGQGASAFGQGAGSNSGGAQGGSWWQQVLGTGAGVVGKAFGLNPQAPKPPASSMLVPAVLLLGAGAVAVFIFTRKPRRRAYA